MKQNKKRAKRKSDFLSLFIFSFAIVFAAIVLANVFAVFFDCVFNGFNNFTSRLCDLPYLLYALISLVFSTVFTLRVYV